MKDTQVAVLLENIDDKLESLAEIVGNVNDRLMNVEQKVAVIPQMADDLKVLKSAVTDQGRQQSELETRVSRLETMPARA